MIQHCDCYLCAGTSQTKATIIVSHGTAHRGSHRTDIYSNCGPRQLLVDFDAATAHYAAVGASRALARPRRERPRTRVTPTAPRARERVDWSTMPRRAPRRI